MSPLIGAAVFTTIVQRIFVVRHLGIAYWPFALVFELLMSIVFVSVAVLVAAGIRRVSRRFTLTKWLNAVAGALAFTLLWLLYDFAFDPGVKRVS